MENGKWKIVVRFVAQLLYFPFLLVSFLIPKTTTDNKTLEYRSSLPESFVSIVDCRLLVVS